MKRSDGIEVPILTDKEKEAKAKAFQEQKTIIDQNTGAFWQIGKAFAVIRENKLFLGVDAGDEIEVGKKYWGFSKGYVTQRIQAAEVMDRLQDAFTDCKRQMPTNEYQCRMLRKFFEVGEWATQWKLLCKELGRVPTGDEIAKFADGDNTTIDEGQAESLEQALDLDFKDFSDSMQKIDALEIDFKNLDITTRAEMLANVKKTIDKLKEIAAKLEMGNDED